jgi:hypothetical protein
MVESQAVIRPFDWRDLALLYRVRDSGLCTDAELAFTRGVNALQHALLDVFTPGKTTITLVARPRRRDGDPAVGQCVLRNGLPNARLSFIGPSTALDQDNGAELLEALARASGEHGAHNLVADVEEGSPAFESLRLAGFAVYARQRIWSVDGSSDELEGAAENPWRAETAEDEFAAQGLYLNLVPGLVQQVEPPPERSSHNLVLWQEGQLMGYLDLLRGPLGTWVQPYVHPAAQSFDRMLATFLASGPSPNRPLFVCVRSYQSWMGGPLEHLGFVPVSDQAVMVKRLAAMLRRPVASPLPAVEGKYPEPSAPIVRAEPAPGASQPSGGR